jgi:nucleotide-binding universal stress UspA family protein
MAIARRGATVRRGASRTRRNRAPFKTILCPTDFSVAANKAVAYAKRLAREADAQLIVMSAVEWPFGAAVEFGPVAEVQEGLEEEARKALARLLPRSIRVSVPWTAEQSVSHTSCGQSDSSRTN